LFVAGGGVDIGKWYTEPLEARLKLLCDLLVYFGEPGLAVVGIADLVEILSVGVCE
jgi:hypothetical protein